jgi:alkylation response protein AidB-like acyl-CoA dehydrogenase
MLTSLKRSARRLVSEVAAYVDKSVLAYNAGELTAVEAAKGYVSELQKRALDRCLQVHGGYG